MGGRMDLLRGWTRFFL